MEAGFNISTTNQSPLSVIESSTFQILPWELLQEIFGHLNGRSLVICKRVCKTWRDHITYLEQVHTIELICLFMHVGPTPRNFQLELL